LYYILIWLFRS